MAQSPSVQQQTTWRSVTASPDSFRSPASLLGNDNSFLGQPFSDSLGIDIGGWGEHSIRSDRLQSLESAKSSSSLSSVQVPSIAEQAPATPKGASRDTHREPAPRRHSEKTFRSGEGPSVSLAVPYANTTPLARPTLGDRPVTATSMVNGVLKHSRTSTPMNETPTSKAAKRHTLNMLNPVNLLMRRRSQVPPAVIEDDSSTKSLKVPPMALPDNYDPRIRGSVVHDFSAPRQHRASSFQNLRHIPSYQDSSLSRDSPRSPDLSADGPQSSTGNGHKRASERSFFKEQFDETIDDRQRASAIQAEALANQHFLKRFSQQNQSQPVLPSHDMAQTQQPDFQASRQSIGDWQTRLTDPSSVATSSGSVGQPLTDKRVDHFSQVSSLVESRDRTFHTLNELGSTRLSQTLSTGDPQRPSMSSDPDASYSQGSTRDETEDGLPKHFKSNASRFSFQLAGNESALEERLLEERSKAQRASADVKKAPIEEDEEDFFDENAMYDRDELEHLADDDESEIELTGRSLGSYTAAAPAGAGQTTSAAELPVFVTPGVSFTMQPNANIEQYLQWERAQLAQSQLSCPDDEKPIRTQRDSSQLFEKSKDQFDNEKRSDSHQGFPQTHLSAPVNPPQEFRRSRASHEFDDDLYFNDGSIAPFHKHGDNISHEEVDEDKLFGSDYEDELDNKHGHLTHPQKQALAVEDDFSQSSMTLAAGDLAAYHNALAEATQKAVTDGRFSRRASIATSTSKYSQRSLGSRSSSVSRTEHVSHNVSTTEPPKIVVGPRDSYSGFDFGFNDPTTSSSGGTPMSATFPVNAMTVDPVTSSSPLTISTSFSPDPFVTTFDDSAHSDDDIISEANASILAYDDEGFYGREFGFFARPRANSGASASNHAEEVEMVNGGYFGNPGETTIERQYSIKEPNLTPITERSEFSTRDSLIGGPFSPGMAGSPAFAAQLARLSPLALAQMHEDDPGYEALAQRLRNSVFTDGTGRSGSVSSLSSAGGASLPFGLPTRGSWAGASGVGAQFMHRGSTGGGLAGPAGNGGWLSNAGSTRSSIRMSRSQSEMYDQTDITLTDSPISSGRSARLGPAPLGDRDLNATPRKGDAEPSTPTTAIKDRPSSGFAEASARQSGSGGDNVT